MEDLRRASRRRLASSGLLALALALLLPAAGLPLRAGAAEVGLVEIAKLPSAFRFAPAQERYLEIDVSARRLFEIGQPALGTGLAIAAFDLDTLRKVGTLDIPKARFGSFAGGQRSAVDELHHRMFVLYSPSQGAADVAGDFTGGMLALAVVDTTTLRLIGTRPLVDLLATPRDQSQGVGTTGVKAISYYAPEDRLYVVTEETAARAGSIVLDTHLVVVHELDASRLTEGIASRNWSYPIPQCASVVGSPEEHGVLRSGDSVFVPCQVPKVDAGPNRPQVDTAGIVRLRIVPNASQLDIGGFSVNFLPIGGDLTRGPVVVDPVEQRLFIRNDGADISESGVLGFDARSAAVIGKIVGPGVLGLGVDRAQSRLYAFAQSDTEAGGEVVAIVESTRGLPIGQGRSHRLKLHANPELSELPRIIVDPVRRRLFWELGSPLGSSDDANPGYAVIEDRIPASGPPPDDRPDDNTIDAAEGPDTDVNFAGGARAYGSRIRWVNGVGGFVKNLDLLLADLEPILDFYVSSETRDLRFGRVANATLGNAETSARAIGAEFDAATAAELEEIARNLGLSSAEPPPEGDPPPEGEPAAEDTDNLIEQTIGPKDEARCADFSGEPARAAADGATAACDLKKASVTGASEYRLRLPAELGDGITLAIGSARSDVSTVRDPMRGIVSIAEAESRDVLLEIPGLVAVDIGRVYTRAETFARGRPGTAGSATFVREISDVVVRTASGTQQVCSGPCSVDEVATILNRVLGTRMHVEFPRYDAARAKGTPGGYEALVVRDPFEQANDQFVNLQGEDAGLEVPGMQLTVFADGRVSSRVVLYLAAVSAESHYGIYRLAADLPPGPPPIVSLPGSGSGAGPDLAPPPTAGEGGGPLGELIRRTVRSFKFFLASPGQSVRAFLFWGFLASPLLLLRRRHRAGAGSRPGR